jgi:ribose-phosphate pyrophosphokinase
MFPNGKGAVQMVMEKTEQGFDAEHLGIIGMRGCEELAQSVDSYLRWWHPEDTDETKAIESTNSFLISVSCPRFGSGEAKGLIRQSVRGHDLFIICDMFNYGVTYRMYDQIVPMSPDDHYQDLKRIISACGGKAKRINVIMPMLYEGRQHKRSSRESLDCAIALQELVHMGVDNLITFDAHDPRVQNAIPLSGFENVKPAYQMLKAMENQVSDIKFERDKLMIISQDEGAMSRCIYFSSVLGVDLGMFYKRRNYSIIVNGRNPIEAHEYLGDDVEGKDVIIVDDMISSGDSMLDIVKQLHKRKAKRVYVFSTFGLFSEGLQSFDEAYNEGLLEKVFTTNLIYRTPELLKRKWYCEVDMSKYIAYIIDALCCDKSMSTLLNPVERIKELLARNQAGI